MSGEKEQGADGPLSPALDQTLPSEAGSSEAVVISVSAGFPAPHWDKYEFVEVLGRGGMGAVYRARDRRLGRAVALKFIHGQDPGMVQRFMQEARAQSRLDHQHICKVYEVGTVDGKPYIAMELVEGQTLDRAAAQLTLQEKLQLLMTCAEALHAAHEQGIIHRDIKPSNIMVERSRDGSLRPVIMDFGLARESGDAHGLTESGAVMGTPAYMSPEQARGEARRLDRRSDVYSLGATLYDVLTGRPPFEDQAVLSILLKVMNEAPRPLRAHTQSIPDAVELIVSKCLNKEPAQRYATARALAEDLGRYLSAQRVHARRLAYTYRLWFWARQNKTLAMVAAALLVSLLAMAGLGIRARWVALRKERQAQEQQELARFIGQSVKDLEWVARTAYLLPLHDTRYEKGLVRARMHEIEAELQRKGSAGGPLAAYARGRGHLALHRWQEAHAALALAEKLGHKDPELDYALGRALGALYSQALDDARKSGDKSFFAKRKAELDEELLKPTLQHLAQSRTLTTVSTAYVEGLVAYYQEQYDVALERADLAKSQAPWLYEAVQLGGDVLLARARAARDRGEHAQAEKSFQAAVARYEQAAEIGRSDHEVHESLAEAFIRWEELDFYRGKNPEAQLAQALAAADRALVAAPVESHGDTKKAYAYFFQGEYAQNRAGTEEVVKLRQAQLAEGEKAIARHADDAYAHEIVGIASFRIAESKFSTGQDVQALLDSAYAHFAIAVKIAPRFVWAYNDHALALLVEAAAKNQRMIDPVDATTKAVRLAEKAVEIDPEYIHAYGTMAIAHIRAAAWLTENGKDPQSHILDGLAAAKKTISINEKYYLAYGNMASLYVVSCFYAYLSGVPIDVISADALRAWDSMLRLSSGTPDVYSGMAIIHYETARSNILNDINIDNSISAGMETTERCLRAFPQDLYCQEIQSRLLAVDAAWKQKQGKPHAAELAQASRLSKQVLAKLTDDQDALLAGAEISRQVATEALQRGQRPLQEIQYGLGAIKRAAQGTVGLPRAAALAGRLLLLQAKLERTPQTKQATLVAARAALADAFARNPLLKRHDSGAMEEVEGLLKGR